MTTPTPTTSSASVSRTLARKVYLLIALCVWIVTGAGRWRRRRAVVLCYHGVRDAQRAAFEAQMRRLRGRVIPTSDLAGPFSGRGAPRIVITFDDAFANLIPNALPALREHNLPAAIFAVSTNFGVAPRWAMPADHPERGERVMTEEELKTVADSPNVLIGSHTRTHPRLSDIAPDQLQRELTQSAAELASLLDHPVRELALPHGAWTPAVLSAARAAGYERIYTLEHDLEPSNLGDGVVGRFSVSPDTSMLEFRLMIDGAYAWLGPLRRALRRRGASAESPTESAVGAAA